MGLAAVHELGQEAPCSLSPRSADKAAERLVQRFFAHFRYRRMY